MNTSTLSTPRIASTTDLTRYATSATDSVVLADGGSQDTVELGGQAPAEVNHKQMRAFCTKLQLEGGKQDMRQLLYQMQSATGLKMALTPDHHVKILGKPAKDNYAGQAFQMMAEVPGTTHLRACHGHQPLPEKTGVTNVYPQALQTLTQTHGRLQGASALGEALATASLRSHSGHAAEFQSATRKVLVEKGGMTRAEVGAVHNPFQQLVKAAFLTSAMQTAEISPTAGPSQQPLLASWLDENDAPSPFQAEGLMSGEAVQSTNYGSA